MDLQVAPNFTTSTMSNPTSSARSPSPTYHPQVIRSDPEELRCRVGKLGWYHSIDLGRGVVTPGAVALDVIDNAHMPELKGRSVLDVGAWDGAYSFRAERLGASRVVALDHYAWGVDLHRRQQYWDECARRGELPDHTLDETRFWDPALPGRRGFDLAREALGSSVEPVVADFMTADLDALGSFDVVLYLGVLYHMREPLTALQRVRRVAKEVAVVETAAIKFRGHSGHSLVQFVAGNDLRHDFGNWYVPTEAALHQMCRAAGFSRVLTRRSPPSSFRAVVRRFLRPDYRLLVHAFA
jgi:tRNA (mo5U34)-methyltransferase